MAGSLTITYTQPVNASANVTVASINVNVSTIMGTESTIGIGSDYQSIVNTIMLRGLWNGNSFIPAKQITLVQYNG